MDVQEATRRRRNVRAFADERIEDSVLGRLVDAARHAPSSMNEQRWGFVVVTDRDGLRRLARLGSYADHVAEAAAAVACVIPDSDATEERESIAFDLGQAVQNLMLAAWEAGIGSCHATVDHPEGVSELLDLPAGFRCDLVLSLGYPADPSVVKRGPRKGGRKPLAEVLHRDRW
jgi:nitroreductase